MKKVFSMLFVVVLVISLLASSVSAVATTEFTVPKAGTAPTIDGTYTASEWANAVSFTVSQAAIATNGRGWFSAATPASGVFYYLWGDAGLYIAADINDAQIDATKYTAGAPLNVTDGIQIELDPMNLKIAGYTKSYIFDFVPQSSGGGAIWYEHFRHAGAPSAANVQVEATMKTGGYVIEALIPWDALRELDETFVAEVGTEIGFGSIIMDIDGTNNALVGDYGATIAALCSSDGFNTLILGAAASSNDSSAATSTPDTASPLVPMAVVMMIALISVAFVVKSKVKA